MTHRFYLFTGLLVLMSVAAVGEANAQSQPGNAGSAGAAFKPPSAQASGGWPAPGRLVVHPLTSTVYWVDGAGGNSGVIVGDKGVTVIDTKVVASSGRELLDDIANITPKPVNTVILTHGDIDHVVGLAAFPDGVQIIAQVETQRRMQTESAAGHGLVPPNRLPNRTVESKEVTQLNGVKVELLHWGPAHTAGDLVIYLPEQKIVFTGDIFTEDALPLIHRDLNGTSGGWLETAKGVVALDADRFVIGHGDVQTKQALQQRVAVAEAEKRQIEQRVANGETLAQIQAAVGDPPPGQVGYGPPHFPAFSEIVYDELAAATAQRSNPDSNPLWQKFMQARKAGDKQAAIDYLRQAAAAGDSNAEAQLGEEYRGGDFELAGALPLDEHKSYQYTQQALAAGNIRAMTDMGVVYMQGIGTKQDYAAAQTWFLKATEGGDMKAARYVGVNFEQGTGAQVDYKKAADYYRRAADKGDITGQCLLGSLYERGLGVEKSYAMASEWYLKSATRGDRVASGGMVALGNLYETRTDGQRDPKAAIDWYRKAAAQENAVAKAEVERLSADKPSPVAAGRNLCLSPFP